jgi:hypothetical protein
MDNRRQRTELKKSDWSARWRTGHFRQNITYLKIHHKPPVSHPKVEGLYDFRSANLRKAKLQEAKLNNCNLDEAQMYQAILTKATLSKSQLIEADLCYSDLSNTRIDNSNLINTRLKEANLSRSSFINSNLTGADLRNANFFEVNISGANLSLANLSNAKHLETLIGKPSSVDGAIIDFDTWKSIKETSLGLMLEKAGREMIYFPSETPSKSRLFISYSSKDSETVNKLAEYVQEVGFDIWLDQKDIVIGQPILDRIRDGVTKESDYVLIILSKHSTVSEWCKLELRMAYEKELTTKRIVVLPIRIDDADVPDEVKTKKYFQLDINDRASVNTLISQIRSLEKI